MRMFALLLVVAACAGDSTLEREMATMRAHDQHVWNPTSEPAMEAARDVFDRIDFAGKTGAEVSDMIGAPYKVDGDVWTYMFHDGEQGVVRKLHFAGPRVGRVEVVLTQ